MGHSAALINTMKCGLSIVLYMEKVYVVSETNMYTSLTNEVDPSLKHLLLGNI